MDDRNDFAVWVADAMLQATGDAFGAASLNELLANSATPAEFDTKLDEAASQEQRPGDFGLEFIGPLLPVLLVTFGRELWDSYSKELVEKGGKALADTTVDAIKALFRRKVSAPEEWSATDAKLRNAAAKSGLSTEQTEQLITTLHSTELTRTILAP